MSEPTKAAELPAQYRKAAPPQPRTLSNLQIGETVRIKWSDVRVDAKWGVWVNPNAVIFDSHAVFFDSHGSDATVGVTQTKGGYQLNLAHSMDAKGSIPNDPSCTSFADQGFVPVFLVK